ncbi:hypothetical protein [Brevundimonas sp.]|uniref:hypothetical protein n=1 Tax=Brevundimonas sp. TaxID=1871086 RepID=UPI002FDB15F6
MFKTPLAALCSAALICVGVTSPGFAQTTSSGSTVRGSSTAAQTQQNRETSRSNREAAESQGRIRTPRRQRQAAPADPAVVMAEAQAVLTAAGDNCTPTEAAFMGQDDQHQKVYEVVCAAGTGPGYIMVAKTPPAAPELLDCVLLAGQAERARAANPAAEADTCKLPGNQNPLGIITGYAQAAGITCTIDQGMSIGRNAGKDVYEIGCNGADGYWVERDDNGAWTKTECTIITAQNANCRFTTTGEIAASFKTRLAGTAADDCDVTQVRFMGANNNGRFYEAKCAAEGVGYIARTNGEGAVQQVYACATAARIGGGCTLTTAAPAAANE